MISSELEARILRLYHVEKWKKGTIATQLELHHSVVDRVINQSQARVSLKTRSSILDPFLPFIKETLKTYPRLNAARLYRMVQERGYLGGPDHLRHMVASLRPKPPREAFLRLKTLPAEQAQVDWAHFGKITFGRAERPLMAFVMVLSYSRMLFFEFFVGANTSNFLVGHQHAFDAFGGIPRVILYDNLKSVVLQRKGDAILFNPLLLSFAAAYHYEPRPVAVRRGNEKARVERAIGYIRTAFFAARSFTDLDQLNAQASQFRQNDAKQRRFADDSSLSIEQAFLKEQPKLLALPDAPFPTDEKVEVSVGKTPYIRFDKNDYSVPHTAVGKSLTVLASPKTVRILDGLTLLAAHPRCYDQHQQIEDPQHLTDLWHQKRNAKQHRGLDRLHHAAPQSQDLLAIVAQRGANLGGTTTGLLRLLDQYGPTELQQAIDEALAKDTPHLAALHHILDRRRFEQGKPPCCPLPLPDDPRIKNLSVMPPNLKNYDLIFKQEMTHDDDPTHG